MSNVLDRPIVGKGWCGNWRGHFANNSRGISTQNKINAVRLLSIKGDALTLG